MPDVYHCPDCEHGLTDCGNVWHCPVCHKHWTYAALAMWLVLDVAHELAEVVYTDADRGYDNWAFAQDYGSAP